MTVVKVGTTGAKPTNGSEKIIGDPVLSPDTMAKKRKLQKLLIEAVGGTTLGSIPSKPQPGRRKDQTDRSFAALIVNGLEWMCGPMPLGETTYNVLLDKFIEALRHA